jgi:hypothetical protein
MPDAKHQNLPAVVVGIVNFMREARLPLVRGLGFFAFLALFAKNAFFVFHFSPESKTSKTSTAVVLAVTLE